MSKSTSASGQVQKIEVTLGGNDGFRHAIRKEHNLLIKNPEYGDAVVDYRHCGTTLVFTTDVSVAVAVEKFLDEFDKQRGNA